MQNRILFHLIIVGGLFFLACQVAQPPNTPTQLSSSTESAELPADGVPVVQTISTQVRSSLSTAIELSPTRPTRQAVIEQVNDEIGQRVYVLYGLTEEEIKLIEGKK